MKASVCMSSYNRDPAVLRQVLESVCIQKPPFEWEVIVVDDGSDCGAPEVCREFPVRYHRIERPSRRRSPSVAHNVVWRMAKADIIIAQNDDVVHQTANSIETLCRVLENNANSFVLATVLACNKEGVPQRVYTGSWPKSYAPPSRRVQNRRRPYFFLGALWRSHIYAIGGEDEEFAENGGFSLEDRWFARCLKMGLGLKGKYTREVIAHHMWHESRKIGRRREVKMNKDVYYRKVAEARRTGVWLSSGGPWELSSVATS